MTLHVPDISTDDDTLGAALRYAAAGWYVLPIDPRGKHAGSIVGKGWPAQSSREPEQLAAWFAGTDYALALHVGRSGALAFDVDDPDQLPPVLLEAFRRDRPPHQSTRRDVNGRGHVLYAVPAGRDLGNRVGKLGGGWGEVRGRNGIVVVAPTVHSKAEVGGRYAWVRTGPLPVLPDDLGELLPDALSTDDAATDEEVQAFLAEHACDEHPGLLRAVLSTYELKVAKGSSRHDTAVGSLTWALKEASAGLYGAQAAHDALRELFLASLKAPCGKEPPRPPTVGEWSGIAAWAVAQARTADLDAVRALADKHLSERDAEQVKSAQWLEDLAAAPTLEQVEPAPADGLAAWVDEHYPALDWQEAFSRDRSEVDWLVEPLLEAGRVVAVYSPPKTGKSLLALDVAAALATGRSCLGQAARPPLAVLYVDLENSEDDIVERLSDLGYAAGDLANLRYLSFPNLPALDSEAGGRDLRRIAERYDAQLVVIDTVSRVIEGDEDSSDTFRALYRHAIMPLKKARRTVLRLDHSGKDLTRGQRGSSAKADDVDAVWSLVHRSGAKYDLRRTHSRTNHGADHVELERHTDPLRHTAKLGAGADLELVAELDRLGVPVDAGRPAAREALKAAGVKAASVALEAAIRHRRNRSARLPESPRAAVEPASSPEGATISGQGSGSTPDSRSDDCPGQSAGSSGSRATSPLPALPVCPPPYREGSGAGRTGPGRAKPPPESSKDDPCELCADSPAWQVDGERHPYCARCRANGEAMRLRLAEPNASAWAS